MRKLSPTKAIKHALTSVWTYRSVAIRIAMIWVPVMFLCGLLELYVGPPDPGAQELSSVNLIQMGTGILSIIAVCSMAVSWHRFILRDEMSHGLRLDGNVLRYAGNTLLIMLAMLVPSLLFLVAVLGAPATAVIGLPALVLLGGAVTRLSIKLPAVALGNRDFTFGNAWRVSEGNFWPCLGVFLLSWAITLGGLLVLILAGGALEQANSLLGQIFTLAGAVLLQLFYSIFNASVFTSLYGFFVERRDF